MGLSEYSTDSDHGRIEQRHDSGKHLARGSSRVPHHLHRSLVPRPDQAHDVGPRGRGAAGRVQLFEQGRHADDGFQAPCSAAMAGVRGAAGHPDVPDVPAGTLRAATDLAVKDDPHADPGCELHEHEVGNVLPGKRVFADRHDVRVVVDVDRRAEGSVQGADDVVPVPARHDRRAGGPPGPVGHRAGDADPDALQAGGGDVRSGKEFLADRDHAAEYDLWPLLDAEGHLVLGQDPHRQVGQPDPHVAGADVDGKDGAGVRLEVERCSRPAHGRGSLADLADQADVGQRVEPGGDGRAGLSGDGDELRACAWLRPEQLEHLTDPGGPRQDALQLFHGQK